VALDSKSVRRRPARFNRWQYEPILILMIPFLTVLSAFGAILFFTLQSWIGDAFARLVAIGLLLLLLFGNAFLLLRRPRRERSP
jgi:hypothetical protein